jgi:hypothetical protein
MDSATKRRLDDLMPWYVTGNISDEDRAWVETVLRDYPDGQAELEWHLRVREQIRARFDQVPQDVGLQGLMARVKSGQRRRASPGLASRLRDFVVSLGARPAHAFATALIVVQAGIIGALLLQEAVPPEYSETRSLSPQAAAGPVLQVTFKSDITERDLRLLLIRIGGRVVDGPGQLGDYIVAVPAERIEPARDELEQSGMVDSVTILARQPERQ